MFEPERCPYEGCSNHIAASRGFYTRHGSYKPKCRPRPVPRFRCCSCARTFSRQTFRADYQDKKPWLNVPVIRLLCSGVGYRQSARLLQISRRNLARKAQKISRNAIRLDRNLRRARGHTGGVHGAAGTRMFHFDEFETYEGRRNTRPLSIAVVIESRSRFLVASIAAPIRPKGRMTRRRRVALEAEDARNGRRNDRSLVACRGALRAAAEFAGISPNVVLYTDRKSTYPSLARRAFSKRAVRHVRVSSREKRDVGNPLFPINHTEALMRDLMGRLRRRSWLVSKRREFLNRHLGLYAAWRNWVRPRFNNDVKSPAQLVGLASRRLRPGELAGWRQDWGRRSPSPFAAC